MFSLLSRTFVIPKFGIPEPTVWRFFSQSNTRYTAPLHEDPEARRKRLDKRNERQRQKYRNDPEYREREIARHPIKDPMRRNQTKQYMRLANKNWRAQNPEAYKKSREKGLLRDVRRYANDPRFPFLKCLSLLARYAWFREELPWKAHKPVLYEEKVPKQCAGCDRKHRGGGLKLWWELRKDDTQEEADEYLCHTCYVPRENWQDALPRGYEDVKSLREIRIRKRMLDGSNHGSHSMGNTKSK